MLFRRLLYLYPAISLHEVILRAAAQIENSTGILLSATSSDTSNYAFSVAPGFELQNIYASQNVFIIDFWALTFAAAIDIAQKDFTQSSDGYITTPMGEPIQLQVTPSSSVYPHLQNNHIIWAVQRVAEIELQRRQYTTLRADITILGPPRRGVSERVNVGHLIIQTRPPREGQSRTIESNKTESEYRPSLLTQGTIPGNDDVPTIRFKFLEDGKAIKLEALFLTILRTIVMIAVPDKSEVMQYDMNRYDAETDITIIFYRLKGIEIPVTFFDLLAALDTCTGHGLVQRRFQDAEALVVKEGESVAYLQIRKGHQQPHSEDEIKSAIISF